MIGKYDKVIEIHEKDFRFCKGNKRTCDKSISALISLPIRNIYQIKNAGGDKGLSISKCLKKILTHPEVLKLFPMPKIKEERIKYIIKGGRKTKEPENK